ncbi:ABC transporter ATP-binding protein [soil metagenome]
MERIIEVRGLNKSYGEFHAVDNLDMEVFRGDVFGFLGPNGAGKSTTIRMLLSLIKPTSGSIKIFNQDLSTHRIKILSRIGCIVEKPDFYRYLTAKKNLELLARLSGVQVNGKRIDELLEFVGLSGRGDDLVKNYSHGMKQRLGLAQALVHDPELIILDEPTTGLDPQGIIDIRNLILSLSKDKGKTIFLSSHILPELELIANRLAIINKGKTVAQGELKVLLSDEDRIVSVNINKVAEAIDKIKMSKWNAVYKGSDQDTIRFQIHLADVPELNRWFLNEGFDVFSIESRRQLEDLFLKLTESAERMMN